MFPSQTVKFLIAEQKFMEHLEARETKKALSVLRNELAPLNRNQERLHQLSRYVNRASTVNRSGSSDLFARPMICSSGMLYCHLQLHDVRRPIGTARTVRLVRHWPLVSTATPRRFAECVKVFFAQDKACAN